MPPLSELTALSPLDGRYARHTGVLRATMSEYGLIRYRVLVEVEWLKALAAEPAIVELPAFDAATLATLDAIVTNFDAAAATRVKTIERSTNHDVKAVEYYLREQIADVPALERAIPFLHFACTSEDINNLSYGLMLRDARDTIVAPALGAIRDELKRLAHAHAELPMLARTHGQTATPTTLGKEMANVAARLAEQLAQFEAVAMLGKINGAVGNYNAHVVAYPEVDWPALSRRFVSGLGLSWNAYTTQIEPHDCVAAYADALARVNTVLIDLARDVWSYISIGYFKQKKVEGEVGSSTMPHKVNPIDFENAEGNLGLADALLGHFSRKLPISRLQRDLTDSTVLRNLGAALGYTMIACRSLSQGLAKLEVDGEALARDLDQAWEILAEPVQTVMRRYGIADSYEQLKQLTRGQRVDRAGLHAFVDGLAIPQAARDALKSLTPAAYVGLAPRLAREI
ncbi:MAG: adenylosuccinate lyase [Gammaproteobacteria bacterium]|nr:adenylosuccinate lyase [Gammaproteobacteria bacterium]